MKILDRTQIEAILPALDLLPAIEQGFIDYSAGRAVVPPVGELLLERGEVHIKYGFIQGDPYYVIKIASGFYGNPSLGLPSGDGLMMVFSQETGQLACLLLDEGHLTDVRTAAAGALAARVLAPADVRRIGVVGTGTQARLQVQYLETITPCREVLAWGRSAEALAGYRDSMQERGFQVETTLEGREILATCNLVVTATPATAPLLFADDLQPGTHITAVGSDTPHKQELDAEILRRAHVVVADSLAQCLARGEIYQAIQAGCLTADRVVELGSLLASGQRGRTAETQITVADLTGVAVQDIKIAEMVFRGLE